MYLTALPQPEMELSCDHPCFGCPVRDRAVCNALGHRELASLRRSGSHKTLSAGDALCWEGEQAASVYSVTHGVLRLSKLLPDGRRQVAGFAFPGDFLGLTLEDEHPFTAEAVCETQLCQFARPRFEHFLAEHPHMERRLYSAAAHELSAARDQLVLLGRKTAAERLASFILQMARRTQQVPGTPPRVMLPMSRTDIADYLGLRIETVSRELGALKSARLVRMMSLHELQITDRDRLTELAAL